jgi:hypothetical protein
MFFRKAIFGLFAFAAVAFGVAASLEPARAAVLWAADEDTDLTFIGSININTTSGDFRAGWARLALQASCNGGNDPPTCRFYSPIFTPTQDLWLHAETSVSVSAVASGYEPVCAITADGTPRLCIWGNGSGQTTIASRSTGGSFTPLQTCIIGGFPVSGALAKMDWHIVFSTTGSVDLYSNGVDVCSYSGDTTGSSGQTQVEQFYFYNAAPSGLSGQINWSEELASTTDTRSMGEFTCYPAGDGTNQTWTGSYTAINPTTINDASQIYTTSSSDVAEFSCPSLPSGTFQVVAVSETVRLSIGSSGPQNFYFITRPATGGTDYNNGSTTAGTASYQNYNYIWATNPATSAPWTAADIAAGFNFGAQSEP